VLIKAVLIQISEAARLIAARWLRAVLSVRIAIPRQASSLLKQRSTTLLPR
jgi:hypothetical protein